MAWLFTTTALPFLTTFVNENDVKTLLRPTPPITHSFKILIWIFCCLLEWLEKGLKSSWKIDGSLLDLHATHVQGNSWIRRPLLRFYFACNFASEMRRLSWTVLVHSASVITHHLLSLLLHSAFRVNKFLKVCQMMDRQHFRSVLNGHS